MAAITRDKMKELREHFAARQHEILALTCALVEAESPSGDKDGSSAVVSLLASAASSITSVKSVERITAENFGEHLRIHAFTYRTQHRPLLILVTTAPVDPRRPYKE